jgi:hypothetical protein
MGEVSLDGLNVLAIGYFKGNIWAGETKFSGAFFFDDDLYNWLDK